MVDQIVELDRLRNGHLQLDVRGVVELDAREEIGDEREEERFVFVDQLRHVHVPQHPHHDRTLGLARSRSLLCAKRSQHRQNVAQPKVIMHLKYTNKKKTILKAILKLAVEVMEAAYLFGQLLLAEFVQNEELARKDDVLLETARRKLDALDDLTIGNHHRH